MNKKNVLIVILLNCYVALLFFLSFQLHLKLYRSKILKISSTATFPTSSTFNLPKFNLDSIFSHNHSWTNQLDQNEVITLITTGDIIPARTVNFKMTAYNNFTHPFLRTADFLKSADITLINLESPLTENCPITNEGMTFCGNQRFIDGLLFADIDVVNLANNHTLNWGVEGLYQTTNLLEQNNILTSGFPTNYSGPKNSLQPVISNTSGSGQTIKHIKGTTLGFLGWNLLEKYDENDVLKTISQSKKEVDLLIVSVHWGAEYKPYPAEWQKELAYKMIDSGADLIVGNHPHWIQPIEIYKEKLIIYAHGNFIFDQEWSQETKTGFIAKTTFWRKKIIDVEIFPIFISDYNQPEFLQNEEKEKILEDLKNLSLTQKAS